jgi:hypothetical protein
MTFSKNKNGLIRINIKYQKRRKLPEMSPVIQGEIEGGSGSNIILQKKDGWE